MTFVKGESGNIYGRPRKNTRHSIRTVKGMIENFIKRNISPAKLQQMFDGLNDKEKLETLTGLLPYILAKAQPLTFEGLNDHDLNLLYDQVMAGLQGQKPVIHLNGNSNDNGQENED